MEKKKTLIRLSRPRRIGRAGAALAVARCADHNSGVLVPLGAMVLAMRPTAACALGDSARRRNLVELSTDNGDGFARIGRGQNR